MEVFAITEVPDELDTDDSLLMNIINSLPVFCRHITEEVILQQFAGRVAVLSHNKLCLLK